MPVLDLLEPDGSLSVLAHIRLLAAICYPRNEAKRKQLFLTFAVESISKHLEPGKTIPLSASLAGKLASSPSAEKAWAAAFRWAGNSWIAGEMLLLMLNGYMNHPDKDISATKAAWLIPRLYNGRETFGGDSVLRSKRSVWRAWTEFKSVSHFHAVRGDWLRERDRETEDSEGFLRFQIERLPDYLALAEGFRRAAIERRILKHGDTWHVPNIRPAPFGFPPLPDSTLSILDEYKPEHSR